MAPWDCNTGRVGASRDSRQAPAPAPCRGLFGAWLRLWGDGGCLGTTPHHPEGVVGSQQQWWAGNRASPAWSQGLQTCHHPAVHQLKSRLLRPAAHPHHPPRSKPPHAPCRARCGTDAARQGGERHLFEPNPLVLKGERGWGGSWGPEQGQGQLSAPSGCTGTDKALLSQRLCC